MQHFTDKILYKTHQHIIVPITKFLAVFLPLFIISSVLFYFIDINIAIIVIFEVLFAVLIFAWFYFFWVKSYFIISNEKIIVKVRNGIFSKFHMSIHFKNIRDMAFSKNNIMHYALGYGTIFARSSAGAVGDLEAKQIPNIEKVYKILNALHSMDDSERKNISSLDQILLPLSSQKVNNLTEFTVEETLEEVIEKEKNILLNIQGIREVVLLDGVDRKQIFSLEEDRNHGVYEALRKKVLFAATHDVSLRDPDEAIVLQAGEKVIFPSVKFHEIKRDSVISSSPGLAVHEYLVPKFKDFDAYDATLLIGFDI
ncbi:PH domain-containing protein [Candidatus Gracilibacteria bacterium]|nr:PH domain-containing protein [Candidatus Gracilibacteria bacterium]